VILDNGPVGDTRERHRMSIAAVVVDHYGAR